MNKEKITEEELEAWISGCHEGPCCADRDEPIAEENDICEDKTIIESIKFWKKSPKAFSL